MVLRSLTLTLRMIKWEHTIFALPFALIGLLVASAGAPGWVTLGWILVAMVAARSTAMAFNRLADQELDARNPRTAMRELPSGALRRGPVIGFTLATAALLVLAAGQLNPLCLKLSPVALGLVWFYSLTKRFTAAAHLFLGLALGVAPVGAWLAVTGEFAAFPILLAVGVVSWVAGFDILYACQDLEFDRRAGLHSVPARFGPTVARRISRVLHLMTITAWVVAFHRAKLDLTAFAGVPAVGLLLAYEHWLTRSGDLSRIDRAFFEVNSWVGLVLLAAVIADLYWW
jgi:4-hydroxybenzoate polyprenyltransferase